MYPATGLASPTPDMEGKGPEGPIQGALTVPWATGNPAASTSGPPLAPANVSVAPPVSRSC